MARISAHTAFLAKKLYDGISTLTHANGLPVCRIYNDPQAVYGDPKTQGATIAFNIQNSSGRAVMYSEVEQLADEHNIYVRSGGLCNPGGIATFLKFTSTEMKAAFALGHRCSKPLTLDQLGGRIAGVVRVSLGAMSTMSDVNVLLDFLRDQYVEGYLSTAEPSPMLVRSAIQPHTSSVGSSTVVERGANLSINIFDQYEPHKFDQVPDTPTRSRRWRLPLPKFGNTDKSPVVVSSQG
jgi:hypothetical protein